MSKRVRNFEGLTRLTVSEFKEIIDKIRNSWESIERKRSVMGNDHIYQALKIKFYA